jgi:peptide/nickel transport system permease protein
MSKDFITVQGCVVICAIVVAIANLITDLAYAFVDPRIMAQYTGGNKKKKAKAAPAAKEG